jgi:hypothetical protein
MVDSPVLPLRRNADDFLSCFWNFLHPVFPMLHRPTFERRYEKLWEAPQVTTTDNNTGDEVDEERLFLANLNIVLALGCRFSTNVPASQQESLAHDFFRSSRKTYVFDVLDPPSLTMVQHLLLTTLFLQSTNTANGCWNNLGLAVRVAQSIGLHISQSRDNQSSLLKTEMTRRIWHTCVTMDR